jgi:hypothetical protein
LFCSHFLTTITHLRLRVADAYVSKMRGLLFTLSLLASTALGVTAADSNLEIDVTLPVECERKTQRGDKIHVHYRGTLQSNGQKFDASAFTPSLRPD